MVKQVKVPSSSTFADEYLSEFVYGGIDGIITTFSIVAGSAGGELLRKVILILGVSNVLSDGYSMGVSRYLSSKAEIAQGLLINKNPIASAIATFAAFVSIGLMPILPFFFIKSGELAKQISLGVASIIFFLIGYIKGFVIKENKLYAGMETLLIGLSAALISYAVGKTIHQMLPEETLNNVI